MVIAWYFLPDHAEHRCEGMGLNCLFLSSAVCVELGFPCDADDVWLVRNNDPRACHAV
jgi:hypothetical protein